MAEILILGVILPRYLIENLLRLEELDNYLSSPKDFLIIIF